MKVKVELSDEDKIMAIEDYVRGVLNLDTSFYELEDIYTSLGEVTFKVKTLKDLKDEQQRDSERGAE